MTTTINYNDLLKIYKYFQELEKKKVYSSANSHFKMLLNNSEAYYLLPIKNNLEDCSEDIKNALKVIKEENIELDIFKENAQKYTLAKYFVANANHRKKITKNILLSLQNKDVVNHIQAFLIADIDKNYPYYKEKEILKARCRDLNSFAYVYEEVIKSGLIDFSIDKNRQTLLKTIEYLSPGDFSEKRTFLNILNYALQNKDGLKIKEDFFNKNFAIFIENNKTIPQNSLKLFKEISNNIDINDLEKYLSKNKIRDYELFTNNDNGLIETETKGIRYTIDLVKIKRNNPNYNLNNIKRNLKIFEKIAPQLLSDIDDFVHFFFSTDKNYNVNVNYTEIPNERPKSPILIKEIINELLTWKTNMTYDHMKEVLFKHKEMFLLSEKLKKENPRPVKSKSNKI